jgi:hypothetical protein
MKNSWSPALFAKLSGIGLLFLFMVVIVACGSTSNQATPGTPAATITISFGQFIGSPTSSLQKVYCGGWATNATTPYSANGVVNVYGKFTQTDQNNNPVGIGGATATATIVWPDQSTQTTTTTTTSDGLAVFTIPLKASAVNRIVLIQIMFQKGNLTCTIPQAAYFTAILASPTPIGSVTPSPTGSPGGTSTATPTGTPTISPTVGGTSTPSPLPTLPFPPPSPIPTR